jgi:hypothetical protein
LGESTNRIVGGIFVGVALLAAASCALPGPGTDPLPSPATAGNVATAGSAATAQSTVPAQITDPMNKGGEADAQPPVSLPEAEFRHPDYYAMPGQEIRFDVSASLPRGVSIARYEWDFDGDGVTDEVGPLAEALHTYNDTFEGTVKVRITRFTGGSASASASVHIGRGPKDGLPAAPVNITVAVTAESDGLSTVQISWESSGAEPYRWGLTVDGIPAGVVEGNVRTASMTDVHRDRAVEIGVVGFTADKGMGESATVTLPARAG